MEGSKYHAEKDHPTFTSRFTKRWRSYRNSDVPSEVQSCECEDGIPHTARLSALTRLGKDASVTDLHQRRDRNGDVNSKLPSAA